MEKMFGWAGRMVRVDLGSGTVTEMTGPEHAPLFIGGRGVASRLYWDDASAGTGAFDPANHLYFVNGPLGGTAAPAASRWTIAGKSPMADPEQYASGNLGGRLGAALKWAGLDGIDITGASARPVILVVGPGAACSLQDAGGLWGRDAFETIALLEKQFGPQACVAAIGKAGEMRVRFASITGSGGVSATKGFGAVMGAKHLKAVVVTAGHTDVPVARPEELKALRREIRSLWEGEESGRYWSDLTIEDIEKVKNVPCFGCPGICRRGIYRNLQGEQGYRKACVSSYYYYREDMQHSGRMADATFYATQLANRHGLCILDLRFLVTWLPEAGKRGLVDLHSCGLDPEQIGSHAWIENLVDLIISRRGIGDVLAEGSRRSSRALGAEDLIEGMVTRAGFDADYYNPRLFLANAPIYATEPVYPITQLHRVSFAMVKWMVWMGTEGMMGFLTTEKLRRLAQTFWGDVKAAECDTPDKKGQAAVINQNRSYAMENMVLCEWFWPIDFSGNTASGVGDPSLEARLFAAVTGLEMDEQQYLLSGERCVNLCRAIYLREGRRGRRDDVLEEFNFSRPLQMQDPPVGLFNPELMLPGENGELFSRMGATVSRDVFEKIMDDYYEARGWDGASGLFVHGGLERLGLGDLVAELERMGFVKQD